MDELQALREENKRLRKENEKLKRDLELYEMLAELSEQIEQMKIAGEELKKEILAKQPQIEIFKQKYGLKEKKPEQKETFVQMLKAKFNIK
jgi:hypothetical protein